MSGSRSGARGADRRVVGPFTLRHVALLLAVLVGTAVLLALLNAPIAGPAGTALPTPGSGFYRLGEPTTGPAAGQRAPELEGLVDAEMRPLLDLDGQPIRLAELRGRPVWLNFFATWCPPCQEETPVLRAAYRAHRQAGLEIVAISVQETTPADIRAYADLYGLEYPIGFDATGAVFRTYGGFGLPTHVFIDREGIVAYVFYGPLLAEQAELILEPLLAPATDPSQASGR